MNWTCSTYPWWVTRFLSLSFRYKLQFVANNIWWSYKFSLKNSETWKYLIKINFITYIIRFRTILVVKINSSLSCFELAQYMIFKNVQFLVTLRVFSNQNTQEITNLHFNKIHCYTIIRRRYLSHLILVYVTIKFLCIENF